MIFLLNVKNQFLNVESCFPLSKQCHTGSGEQKSYKFTGVTHLEKQSQGQGAPAQADTLSPHLATLGDSCGAPPPLGTLAETARCKQKGPHALKAGPEEH